MRLPIAVMLVTAAGCMDGDRYPTHIIPLAEFDAKASNGTAEFGGDRGMRLVAGTAPVCEVLSGRSTFVTLNGAPGHYDSGSPDRTGDACVGPLFTWDYPYDNVDGKATIVVGDGTAEWTFEVYDPFRYLAFSRLDPDAPITSGSTLAFRLATFGTYADVTIDVFTPERVVIAELTDADLTRTGNEVSFVVPALDPSITRFEVAIEATHQARVDRCDAPRGCEFASKVGDRFDVLVGTVPPN